MFDWDKKKTKINGKRLNDLNFADDVLLITNNIHDLQEMISNLQQSEEIGLNINTAKTKIINSESIQTNIMLQNNTVEDVPTYTSYKESV